MLQTSTVGLGRAIETYLFVIGVLCLLGALGLLARRLHVVLFGVKAGGRVIGHEAREMDDTLSYLPTVEFRDAQGREHRFTSVAGGSTRQPAQGREVRVRYLAADPRRAYIDSFLHMWAAPLALALLGAGGVAARFMH